VLFKKNLEKHRTDDLPFVQSFKEGFLIKEKSALMTNE
jgi:hypothetical protein